MSELYSGIAELTDKTLEHTLQTADRPVLLDFSAGWCGPCHQLAPVIERLADVMGGRVLVAKVDVDRSPESARSFGVRSIPTVLILRSRKVLDTFVGVHSERELREALDRALLPGA